MAQSNLSEDLAPVRQPTFLGTKLSPEDVLYLRQLTFEELREKYIVVNENFVSLKKFTQKQEDKIKRLQTKLQKLSSDQKKSKSRSELKEIKLLNADYEAKIEILNNTISQLRCRIKNLEGRLKVANVQLSSSRKNRVPLTYRHVTPRIDSGLKHNRRAKSLTNISEATATTRKLSDPMCKDDSLRRSKDSLPSSLVEDGDISSEVRYVLEEARKRILMFEDDQEQLLQQLNESQQICEDQRRDLEEKLCSLEKELEMKREELRDRLMQEQREKRDFIRSERQIRAVSARVSALTNHVSDVEGKLRHEKKQKQEVLDALEYLRLEESEKDARLKEAHLHIENLKGELREVKDSLSYFKQLVTQLQSENSQLSEVVLRKDEISEDRNKPSDRKKEGPTKKSSIIQNENEDNKKKIFTLMKQLEEEKERNEKSNNEIKELKSTCHELSLKLKQVKEVKKPAEEQNENLGELKKSLEQYKLLNKSNIYDKMAYNELQSKYTELQLLYREKKMQLESMSSYSDSHTKTLEHLEIEKRTLLGKRNEEVNLLCTKIADLENSLRRNNDLIENLEKQLLFHTVPVVSVDGQILEESVEVDALALNKHHNILEVKIQKAVFKVDVSESFKTFISWVMPIPLKDPLQHTNYAVGSPAQYLHASLYKFKMNFQSFMAIEKDPVKVSLYALLPNNHPHRIGKCTFHFDELMKNPQNTLHGTSEILKSLEECDVVARDYLDPMGLISNSNNEDIDIGTLYYSIRFQKPANEYILKYRKKLLESSVSAPKKIGSNGFAYQISTPSKHGKQSGECSAASPKLATVLVEEHSGRKRTESKSSSDNGSSLPNSQRARRNSQPRMSRGDEISNFPEPTVSSSQVSSLKTDLKLSLVSEISSRNSVHSSKSLSTEGSLVSEPESVDRTSSVKPDCSNISETLHVNSTEQERQEIVATQKKAENTDVKSNGKGKSLKISKFMNIFRSMKSTENPHSQREKVQPKNKVSLLSRSKTLYGDDSSGNVEGQDSESEESSRDDEDLEEEESMSSDTYFEDSLGESSSQTCINSGDSTLKEILNEQSSKGKSPKSKSISNEPRTHFRNMSSGESDESITATSDDVSSGNGVEMDMLRDVDGVLSIEIISLELVKDSPILKDDSVQFLFVAYNGFLDLEQEALETPSSVPKPQPGNKAAFNFVNEISIIQERMAGRYEKFWDQVKLNRNLIFYLISEPPSDQQDEDCKDLGYGTLSLQRIHNFKGAIPLIQQGERKSIIGNLYVKTKFKGLNSQMSKGSI